MPADRNLALARAQRFGFWIGTKLDPRRAVYWQVTYDDQGRMKRKGRNWVEVLPHGVSREPARFAAAEVEMVGPHEWLTYYPEADAPICGWGRPRLPDGAMQYCPKDREEGEPFCRAHMAELQSSEGEEQNGPGEDGSHTE